MNYIDLVLCEGNQGIVVCQAPEFSVSQKDVVILEQNNNSIETLKVIDVLSLAPESEEFKFITSCLDKEPYKLYGKVIIKEFQYKDGDDDDKG